MTDTAISTIMGADNAPWFANVTKIGHPKASVTIVKYETTVFIFHTMNLIRKSYRVRVCSHYRELSEANIGFFGAVGKAASLEYTDHLFMVMDDNPRSEQKHRMKFQLPFMDVSDKYLEDRRDYNRFTADPETTRQLYLFARDCRANYVKTYESERLRNTTPRDFLD